jgi:hypothetical protein
VNRERRQFDEIRVGTVRIARRDRKGLPSSGSAGAKSSRALAIHQARVRQVEALRNGAGKVESLCHDDISPGTCGR